MLNQYSYWTFCKINKIYLINLAYSYFALFYIITRIFIIDELINRLKHKIHQFERIYFLSFASAFARIEIVFFTFLSISPKVSL